MALAIRNVVAFMMMTALFQVSFAAVYKVGDSAGWTPPIFGNVDYNKWASTKKFHVGDAIVFEYNKLFHNVKQVSRHQFKTCNAKFPIATYSSGFDFITLKTLGDLYFVSGVPGDCQAGQKLHIIVIIPLPLPIPLLIPIPIPLPPVTISPVAAPAYAPNASSP